MSRYWIEQLFDKKTWAAMPKTDRNGVSKEEWDRNALIGWDDRLLTFFCSVESSKGNPGNNLAWWFGTDTAELPYVDFLEATIGACFGVDVRFKESTRNQMIADKHAALKSRGLDIPSAFPYVLTHQSVPQDYLNACDRRGDFRD